ncbi:ZFHX3 family protein [Megaselia abdita]
MGPPKKFSGSNSSSNSPAGGKRANRTRFTDYQIKVLQEFFENNSYPKDSDLEYLSKLLLLSPRVIVVWFQNARQKQRKIYENQPNSTFYENDEKKSTNINYTCKKCNLIFQRYYELIRHQKNHCFKEENNKKSAKAKIAAAQVAQSLSSEDSNSSAVDVSCDETIDLSQPSRKRKLSENAGESRYDFLYNYYLKNSVGSSSGGVGDKTLEFLIQFYQFNESKKFFHLDASPHLERTPSPQPQQQQNVIPPPPPQNIIQAPQISNTPNSSISSSQDFYESPMSSPTTIETTISVVEGGQGHNQNQAIQLSQPQINNHKRLRTTILPDQLNLLYECYQTESNPSRKMLEEISKKVNLKKRVVQVWFQNARAKDKKSRNNRFADETSVNQNLNSNITVSSTPPANMALVRELMTNTKDKCMVNGVFNHFFFNVPQAAATNSSEEELEGDDHKIEEKPNKQNSSVYPYYNNYENRTEAGSIY